MPADLKQVENLAARGLNYKQIAAALGIRYQTLVEKRRALKDFSDAIERGKHKADADVGSALFEMAVSKQYPQVTIFWQKPGSDIAKISTLMLAATSI